MRACACGASLEVVQVLIDNGAKVNARRSVSCIVIICSLY